MRRRSAFTLIEMLVVVGIIVLLVGIAAPLLYKAYKSATVARTKADLAAISTALEAYKADHGDYPRVSVPESGAAILGKALMGPGDRVHFNPPTSMTVSNLPPGYSAGSQYKPGDIIQSGTDSSPLAFENLYVCVRECTGQAPPAVGPIKYNVYWTQVSPFDGADGPGFRVRPDINRVAQGKPVGPYLNAGRIPMRGLVFLDAAGNPILYFPVNNAKTDKAIASTLTTQGGYLTVFPYANPQTASSQSTFSIRDNLSSFRRDGETDYANATKRIAGMLGDLGTSTTADTSAPAPDGAITNGTIIEKAVEVNNYLLWTAGTDAMFGPEVPATIVDFKKDITTCDDVTNFR